MANNFKNNPNCKALYRYESGALTVDSIGSNTLTNNNSVSEDTVNYMEGLCSALFSQSGDTNFSIDDSLLDSGFPCKKGETNRSFTICVRIKPNSISGKEAFYIANKTTGGGDTYQQCFRMWVSEADSTVRMALCRNGTDTFSFVSHATALTCNGSNEYFVAFVHDASDGSIRIRILNNSTGVAIGADKTDTFAYTLNIGDSDFIIGKSGIGVFDGNIDEMVLFNDMLSVTEIDAVWAQTYVYPEFITANALSLLYDIADEDSTVSCDNETSDFPIDYALEYDRPFKRLLAQDTTETTIELGYQSSIDTIFLGNCNFSSFKIEIDSVQVDLSTVMDKDSGYYNALIRLGSAITSFKIIIPSQSTVNGESFFAIGAIVAGVRVDLTAKPQYPLRKKLVEPTFEMRFDGQNREVQEIGRSYHLIDFNWNGIISDNYEEIEDIIREMGQAGIGVVYEKWSDYEASYLCQLHGNFPHTRIKDFYRHPLKFRELV